MVDGKLISNQIHEFQELLSGVEKKKTNTQLLMKILKSLAL